MSIDSKTPNLPPARLAWTVWGLAALLYLIAFYQRVAPAVIGDRLMAEFSISGAALGNLSAFYFYSYVAMQIPTGVIADRWGPRKLLAAGAGVATLGTLFFAAAPTLFWANFGRLLIGGSVAVAFVSMLTLATRWFPANRFAFVSGIALFVGIVGGVFGGVPLRALVDLFGWRPVMVGSAALTGVLCVAIWWRVRDDPGEAGYRSYRPEPAAGHHHGSILKGLVEVLSFSNVWLLLIAPIGIAGAILTFGGLWGVPFLRQVYGLDAKTAAAITSAVLVAWAIGGPTLGALSERQGRRKPLYIIGTAVELVCWSVVVFVPLPLFALVPLLLLAGYAAGVMIIGFAYTKESVPSRLTGTASGVCNMGPLMGGMFLQPAVGWMLDRYWQGTMENGARVYSPAAYQAGFLLFVVSLGLALLLSFFTRETHCQPTA